MWPFFVVFFFFSGANCSFLFCFVFFSVTTTRMPKHVYKTFSVFCPYFEMTLLSSPRCPQDLPLISFLPLPKFIPAPSILGFHVCLSSVPGYAGLCPTRNSGCEINFLVFTFLNFFSMVWSYFSISFNSLAFETFSSNLMWRPFYLWLIFFPL